MLFNDSKVVVGSSLSLLFSINMSFSDSEWAWDARDR
ncbi:unnamed protein product [Brassica oleracea]